MPYGLMFWSLIIWIVAYPFLYGLLISRLFGLKKNLDYWIVVCMHFSAGSLGAILFFFLYLAVKIAVIPLAVVYALLIGAEGLIWQLFLKERKLNGFIVSLICNTVYFVPIFLITVLLTLLN